ncbi:hypothetical protein ACW95P_01890 [Candidatus Mycoplasma pogonae]
MAIGFFVGLPLIAINVAAAKNKNLSYEIMTPKIESNLQDQALGSEVLVQNEIKGQMNTNDETQKNNFEPLQKINLRPKVIYKPEWNPMKAGGDRAVRLMFNNTVIVKEDLSEYQFFKMLQDQLKDYIDNMKTPWYTEATNATEKDLRVKKLLNFVLDKPIEDIKTDISKYWIKPNTSLLTIGVIIDQIQKALEELNGAEKIAEKLNNFSLELDTKFAELPKSFKESLHIDLKYNVSPYIMNWKTNLYKIKLKAETKLLEIQKN